MEIKEFEKEYFELKKDPEMELSVLGADDVGDPKKVKIIVNGKEIKNKTAYLICVNLNKEE